jgi:hypothetical protein
MKLSVQNAKYSMQNEKVGAGADGNILHFAFNILH